MVRLAVAEDGSGCARAREGLWRGRSLSAFDFATGKKLWSKAKDLDAPLAFSRSAPSRYLNPSFAPTPRNFRIWRDVYHLGPRFAHPFSRGPRSAEKERRHAAQDEQDHVSNGGGGGRGPGHPGVTATAQTARRNVLWIVDDDHPQYMMDPMPVTRQKIRDQGLNFTSGSTDIPLCGPARVSLLTGLSVTTHECDTNGTWPTFEGSSRGLAERTVARYLKDAGYTTGHFGKYINAHSKSQSVPAFWDRWCEALGDGSDTGGNATTPNRANIDGEITDLPPGNTLCVVSWDVCRLHTRPR